MKPYGHVRGDKANKFNGCPCCSIFNQRHVFNKQKRKTARQNSKHAINFELNEKSCLQD